MRIFRVLSPVVLMVVASVGCGPSVDPEIAALQSELLLTSRPAGGVGIEDAKAAVAESPGDIVLNGQVTSGEFAYWEPDAAIFAVWDVLEDDGHGGEGHDPSNCPFCKRRLAKYMERRAMVKVVDSAGEVIPIEARKLLGIKENQRVVIQGNASIDKAGNLVLSANGVYVDS